MGKARDHKCECPEYPSCDSHRAYEWGGGEPDKCEPHGHEGIETIEEVRVKRDILRIMRPFAPDARARIIKAVVSDARLTGPTPVPALQATPEAFTAADIRWLFNNYGFGSVAQDDPTLTDDRLADFVADLNERRALQATGEPPHE